MYEPALQLLCDLFEERLPQLDPGGVEENIDVVNREGTVRP